jgi:hypothetical protein
VAVRVRQRTVVLAALAIVACAAAALVLILATSPGPSRVGGGSFPAPGSLPAPVLYLSPTGDDGGRCTRSQPCRSFDRAYHEARPGTVVQIAGGSYGDQVVTPDPDKDGRGCESRLRLGACVVFRPAAGARVVLGGLTLGADYRSVGPAGIAIVAGPGRRLQTGSTNFGQAREIAMWGVSQRNFYIAGGQDIAIRGGSVGGWTSADGTHPEVQRVYGSDPLIVPRRLTIEGVRFHDVNTTSSTAHVDCLQVENGVDVVIRANRFERCGAVGLRLSYGTDAPVGPPTRVLIENNVFGACAHTPVSECYFAAQLGVGHDVLVRNNTFAQELQPTGDAGLARDVRYVGNLGPGIVCEPFIGYAHNVWSAGRCGATDRVAAASALASAARAAGDPADHPAQDINGRRRPKGRAPSAGAREVGR